MKRLLLLLIVFGALPLFGQGTSFPVFNRQGWTMAGAVVGTCTGPADPGTGTLYCTAPVTTYQDWTLTTPCTNQTTIPNPPGPPLGPTHGAGCTNPGLTDSHGNATIFAANGFYWALISGYQVVPQTFPFDIGAGGGGGGPCPFGALYDIQINDPLGLCGADSGIGLLNPTVHTLYENILNANQQVDVSDATNSGLICQGHSTGSAVDSAFCTEPSTTFSPTPTGGYGLFPPDNAPTTLHQAIRVASLTPTNVVTKYGTIPFYPTEFSTTGAGVSLEYELPLDTTNAPSPTTSSDLVRTLVQQQALTAFMGPKAPTDPTTSVVQDNVCVIGDTVTCQNGAAVGSCAISGSNLVCTYTPGSPVIPGDTLYVEGTAICGLGCTGTTFTNADTLSNSWTQLVNIDGSGATTPSGSFWAHSTTGGSDTITFTLLGNESSHYRGYFHFVELQGSVIPDGFAIGSSSVSGAPSFGSVTTTNATDTLLASLYVYNGTGCSFSPGTGFGLIDQGAGLTYTIPVAIGASAKNVAATGTYTPNLTTSCTGLLGTAFTTAFTTNVPLGPAKPFFRLITLGDLDYLFGPLPNPGSCSAGNSIVVNSGTNGYVCGSGGGDTITSPNSTIAVGGTTTATTVDVVGAAGKILAGSTPALTYTPALGVDGSNAGTLQLANGSAAFHTILGTQASANWTFKFPTTAGTNTYVLQTDGSGNTSWVAPSSGTTTTVCSGTITVNPGATSSGACSSAATATCTGLATTDNIMLDFAADPTATTGYVPGAMGTLVKYPTSDTINVKFCNNTGGSITPTSTSFNYRVVR